MARTFTARLAFCVWLSETFRIVTDGAIIAYVVVERLFDYVPATIMKATPDLVRAVPHHLSIMAD